MALLKHLKLQMWLPLVGHIKFALNTVILEKSEITITKGQESYGFSMTLAARKQNSEGK